MRDRGRRSAGVGALMNRGPTLQHSAVLQATARRSQSSAVALSAFAQPSLSHVAISEQRSARCCEAAASVGAC